MRLGLMIQKNLGFLFPKNKETLFKPLLLGFLVFTGFLYLIQNFHAYIDFQENRCLNYRVFISKSINVNQKLKTGEFVSFVGTQESMMGLFNGKRIAKEVVAQPGDHVSISHGELIINGKSIRSQESQTLEKLSKRGKSPIELNTTLKEGEYLVAGNQPGAFDSRYWGVIKRHQIDQKVWPII